MRYEVIVVLMYFFILIGCNNPKQDILNNTSDSGLISTDCSADGELAMLSAPVVISQSYFAQCDKIFTSLKTSIIARDDYHSLANVCMDKLFIEVYYSKDANSLESLKTLANTSAGGNFQLPNGVGRLIEARALSENRLLEDSRFYIQPGRTYSPNRIEYEVRFPHFIGDFNSQNIDLGSYNLIEGERIYYKWAKRIEKENEGDPMLFSPQTFSLTFFKSNKVSAGEDKSITLPETVSVILTGSITNNFQSIVLSSIEWKWVRENFGPPEPPTIVNKNNPITEVNFATHGIHKFELAAMDSCGDFYKDTVSVNVLGQFSSGNPRNTVIRSGEVCSDNGRIMSIRNIADQRLNVTIKLKTDLRSWQDKNTPGAGTIVESTFVVELNANEERVLDCSVSTGTGLNASDREYKTWVILSEEII